jgi:hypothetical protein
VAARLAAKHQIRLFLRPSPYGGTTAIALLPLTIIVAAPGSGQAPDAPGMSGLPCAPVSGQPDEHGHTGDNRPGAASVPTRKYRRLGTAHELPAPAVSGWFSRGQAHSDNADGAR